MRAHEPTAQVGIEVVVLTLRGRVAIASRRAVNPPAQTGGQYPREESAVASAPWRLAMYPSTVVGLENIG